LLDETGLDEILVRFDELVGKIVSEYTVRVEKVIDGANAENRGKGYEQ